jgi:hypothetical protein
MSKACVEDEEVVVEVVSSSRGGAGGTTTGGDHGGGSGGVGECGICDVMCCEEELGKRLRTYTILPSSSLTHRETTGSAA